jgi:hypothetical protein
MAVTVLCAGCSGNNYAGTDQAVDKIVYGSIPGPLNGATLLPDPRSKADYLLGRVVGADGQPISTLKMVDADVSDNTVPQEATFAVSLSGEDHLTFGFKQKFGASLGAEGIDHLGYAIRITGSTVLATNFRYVPTSNCCAARALSPTCANGYVGTIIKGELKVEKLKRITGNVDVSVLGNAIRDYGNVKFESKGALAIGEGYFAVRPDKIGAQNLCASVDPDAGPLLQALPSSAAPPTPAPPR